MNHLDHELHAHLFGCLSAKDIYILGKDLWRRHEDRLTWYADEFTKALGRTPDFRSYWDDNNGLEYLTRDFEVRRPTAFPGFQAAFNLLIALFPVDPDDSSLIQYILRSQRAAGVRYGEYRCPVPPALAGDNLARYFQTLADAAAAVTAESGGAFSARLAVSLSRDPELFATQYRVLQDVLAQNRTSEEMLVAIDFCGAEAGFPPTKARATYQRIIRDNQNRPPLAILTHVGEVWNHLGPRHALRWVHEVATLGAHRIGHGTVLGVAGARLARDASRAHDTVDERRAHGAWLMNHRDKLAEHGYRFDERQLNADLADLTVVDPTKPLALAPEDSDDLERLQEAIANLLKRDGLVIESCPTSNCRLAALEVQEHPLPRLLDFGLRVVIGADDPGIFCTTLAHEERLLKQDFHLSDELILGLAAESARSKASLLARAPRSVGAT